MFLTVVKRAEKTELELTASNLLRYIDFKLSA